MRSITVKDAVIATFNVPVWRNWQTRTTQNRVPSWSVGSTPTTGTIYLNYIA